MNTAAAITTTKSKGAGTSNNDVSGPSGSNSPKKPNPRKDFLVAAANMSWQLAIVVLVPILGGFRLDDHFGSSPFWTATGFVVATFCMMLVVRRQLKLFSPPITQADIDNAKKLRDAEEEDDKQ